MDGTQEAAAASTAGKGTKAMSSPASDQHPTPTSDSLFTHSFGALLGAAVGDAAGAVLEFCGDNNNLTPALVSHAMSMPGGGVFNVGKGQVTDDTELLLALAHALAESDINPEAGDIFPVAGIAARYREWYLSKPFDIGGTTSNAFGWEFSNGVGEMLQHVGDVNVGSKANGALMRCMPISVWAHAASCDIVAEYVMSDARLSHPNETCLHANATYSVALHHLINHPGDSIGAVDIASLWAQQHACEEVRGWLEDDIDEWDGIDATVNIGFVQHAFRMAFYLLRHKTPFHEGMKMVLLKGGDTDTNACIVGGLLGALDPTSIPIHMREAVLGYEYREGDDVGHKRPAWLQPKGLAELTWRLLHRGSKRRKRLDA
eukprot:jgi/Chlat1/7522/Chrsp61S07028